MCISCFSPETPPKDGGDAEPYGTLTSPCFSDADTDLALNRLCDPKRAVGLTSKPSEPLSAGRHRLAVTQQLPSSRSLLTRHMHAY